jgi:hypothetical protein
MKTIHILRAWSAVVLLSACTGPNAFAQTAVTTFAELKSRLKVGQNIRVFNNHVNNPTASEGRVVAVNDNELEIKQGGTWWETERRLVYAADSVRRVENGDSHWNGIVIGGAIGLLLAIWEVNTPQSGEGSGGLSLALFPLAGGAIGNWMDGRINRVIYRSTPGSRITLGPLPPRIGGRRFGVAGSVRFSPR